MTVDIYTQEALTDSDYIIPGPPLYAGAAGASSSTAPSSPVRLFPHSLGLCVALTRCAHTQTTTVGPTTTVTPTTVAPTSTSTAVGTVAHYGQCGGIGWTGATACVSPYTCTALNGASSRLLPDSTPLTHDGTDYYSQCV